MSEFDKLCAKGNRKAVIVLSKVPIIGSSISAGDIAYAVRRSGDSAVAAEFEKALSRHNAARHVLLTGSGISAFYVILEALKKRAPDRDEVVLPAYTAGSLVVAVRKAGLKVRLCDISPDDFNMDRIALPGILSGKTLAVVVVHMFGIGMNGIRDLKKTISPGVYLVEDCAQAMGSIIDGRPVGSFGDVSFYSFARGKNLPAHGGGAIATNSDELAHGISDIYAIRDTQYAIRSQLSLFTTACLFQFAVKPLIYGLFHSLISRFKDTKPPEDFTVGGMSYFQAALGLKLITRAEGMSAKRYSNGMLIIDALKGSDRVTLPAVAPSDKPAFNRLPVMFRDAAAMMEARDRLDSSGIESSRMYDMPLHHMFGLGYGRDEFPVANRFAAGLLTLPVYPSVDVKVLGKMAGIIKKAVG